MKSNREYKSWGQLTEEQKEEAKQQAKYIGYGTEEMRRLKFGVEDGKVKTIRDDNLLSDIFYVEA